MPDPATILIVEDEFLIRMATADAIRDAGFQVVEAANADEAIKLLETCQGIRVVFTDIHMPGSMDGIRLAHAVKQRWPPVRIIATSGRVAQKELDLPAESLFFAKPYRPETIMGALYELTADV